MASTNWENLPSTNTPLNATNLNKIEKKLKTYIIPSDLAPVSGWYLVASGNITGFNNNVFKLSVQQLFSGFSGILYVNIRCDNSSSLNLQSFIWETNTGENANNWKVRFEGNNYYLYCFANEYQKFQIKVLEASDLGYLNEDILTFYSPTTNDRISEPSGYISKNPTNIKEAISVTHYLINGGVYAYKIGKIVIATIDGSMKDQIPNKWTDYPIAKLGVTCSEATKTVLNDQTTGLCVDAFIDTNSDTIYINKRNVDIIDGEWLRGQLIFICNE